MGTQTAWTPNLKDPCLSVVQISDVLRANIGRGMTREEFDAKSGSIGTSIAFTALQALLCIAHDINRIANKVTADG